MHFLRIVLPIPLITLSFGFAQRFTLWCFLRWSFIDGFYLRFYLRRRIVFSDALVDILLAFVKISIIAVSVFLLNLLPRFAFLIGAEELASVVKLVLVKITRLCFQLAVLSNSFLQRLVGLIPLGLDFR